MSTESTYTDPLQECELHWLPNCNVCNHPTKPRKPYRWRQASAVGTTKAEVLAEVATAVGVPFPHLGTAGEQVPFWQGLLRALGLGSYPGSPAESAELVTLLGDVEWSADCATSPGHVTLKGLLRVRDAVVALHREHQSEHPA